MSFLNNYKKYTVPNFALPSFVNKILPDFTSRCILICECKCANPNTLLLKRDRETKGDILLNTKYNFNKNNKHTNMP